MIDHSLPALLVIENPTDPKGRRGPRVKKLLGEVMKLADAEELQLQIVMREDLHKSLLGSLEGTKHKVTKYIAGQFPEELGALLPPKRELWQSEDYHMGTFEAVGLALASYHLRESKRLGNE